MLSRFENFVLDTDRRELRQGDVFVAREPQVFDVLEFLIRTRSRVVSRDDAISRAGRRGTRRAVQMPFGLPAPSS